MAIAYTSIAAMASIVPKLSGLRLEVYSAIRSWQGTGPSIEDLAVKLGRKESSICARIDELRAAGAIEDGPFKTNERSGHVARTYLVMVWREPAAHAGDGQLDLFGGSNQSRGHGAYGAA